MRTYLRFMLMIALLVAASACGKSTPSAPSSASLTGTWSGTGFFRTCVGATCTPISTLNVQLTQSGSSLAGPWTSTQTLPGGGASAGPSGSMSGSVDGTNVSMQFAIGVATTDCTFPINVTATVSGNQMSGTYASANASCSLRLSGNISLTKQ